MVVHPDDGSCLSSCLLTLILFIQAPHLTSPAKGQPNLRKSQVATLQESPIWQSPQKVPCGNIPRKTFIWKLCPNSQSTPRPPGQMIESCPLRLVLGADTLSPTEVGALSVAVHPDDGCLSSTCLQVMFRSACFRQHSVWHFLALKKEL